MTSSSWHRRSFVIFCVRLLVAELHDANAFVAHTMHLKHRPGLALSAFQVSPLLRFRDQGPKQSSTPVEAAEAIRNNGATASPSAPVAAKDVNVMGHSMSLIRAIWLNQAAIFLLSTAIATAATFAVSGSVDFSAMHWTGTPNFHAFFDWRMDELRIMEGVLATVPMVVIGNVLEKSDRRDASQVNFSTTNMVISLFGRRQSSRDPEATQSSRAMGLAGLIALSTGVSEEIVFRGYIPTAIASFTHSLPLAVLGQAILFAMAHVSPKSSPEENRLVGGLQFVNGLWYGVVYAATGGDLLPCILAHALYDMHVLCGTWCSINEQMDYTQDAFQQTLDSHEMEALQKIQMQAGPSLSPETLNLARRFFYAFDYEHKGSLRLSDVHRAVNYAFLKDRSIPEPEDVERAFDRLLQSRDHNIVDSPGDRLTVSEFLRLLFTLKSRGSLPV